MTDTDNNTARQHSWFALFLLLISAALVVVAWPFASALLWATLAAIMFQPLYRWMLVKLGGRRNAAAVASLGIITVAIILPAFAIGSAIVDEAVQLYVAIRDERLDAATWFVRIHDALPLQIQSMIDATGYGEFEAARATVSDIVRTSVGTFAQQALAISGGAFAWVLSFGVGLYVTFFLLRDGKRLGPAVVDALPFPAATRERLAAKFVNIVRATIKGSVVVGIVQGALGAITFLLVGVPSALLLGLLMAIFSLLPALGPAIVWGPVALYLLATGNIGEGLAVVASGVLVVGMADNLLRPILVGRDTGLPDWIVLVATLGGLAAFGLAGIVLGPVLAGLFLTGWKILKEEREPAAKDAQAEDVPAEPAT